MAGQQADLDVHSAFGAGTRSESGAIGSDGGDDGQAEAVPVAVAGAGCGERSMGGAVSGAAARTFTISVCDPLAVRGGEPYGWMGPPPFGAGPSTEEVG